MLDDLKMIHERDAQDALGVAEKQGEQYCRSFGFSWSPPRAIYDVVVAGMGGSGLAAKAYKVAGGLHVPFEVVQDYDLPAYTNENTLLICLSYSGNTEEILSVLDEVVNREDYPSPMIVTISSGGKLLERAKAKNLPHIQLPEGYQPRHTFGYQYRALAEIFDATPLSSGEASAIESAGKWTRKAVDDLLPTVPSKDNPAKKLALELMGSSIAVYSGPKLYPAAYKWKINFNENAKNIAWCNEFPEFNHNELPGWTSHPIDKPYKIVELRSSLEHVRTQKRFEVTERLLSGKRPHPEVIKPQGDTLLQQMMWSIQMGDFVSIYLALLNGLNPSPVDLIEKFKTELNK